jgi:hypothetical protein
MKYAPLALASPRGDDTPRLLDPACEWERRELIELGETIVSQTPSAWPRFQSWMTAVHRLSDDACRSFTPEAALTSLTAEFRRLCLTSAAEQTTGETSPSAQETQPPRNAGAPTSGLYVAYSRDTDSQPSALEKRCPMLPDASEWAADHALFSSAQSGLASVLYWAITQGFWDAQHAPHLTFAGSSVETRTLLDSFNRAGLTWGQPKNGNASRKQDTQASRVILIEPAFCDESANVMNIAAFQKTWRAPSSGEPTLIILDTTLTGPLFPIGEFLESLEGTSAPIVVNLRSGAELDQAGLELANVGVASIYSHKSGGGETQDFGRRLRKARTAVGANLSATNTTVLQAPWFLDGNYFRRYAMAIFDNNARLADDLAGGRRLFANVLHPKFARSRCRWAQAPYTLLHLKEPSTENYKFLDRIISFEARRRGIFLERGKGFGSRGHRFQVVIPKKERGAPHLRVAMGARSTPSLERTCQLMRELSAFRDFSQLTAQYEGVIPH